MKHIKKIIVATVFLLLVALIVPAVPQSSIPIENGGGTGTVSPQSDFPEQD